MSDSALQQVVDAASVAPEVFVMRPDYRALLIAVRGIAPAASDDAAEALLQQAEVRARATLETQDVTQVPHIAAWREAYRAFGAKPQRTRNSLEALTRRAAADALPRVNALTDAYNAISVLHGVPVGGEDLDRYVGAPKLVVATGNEPFETSSHGEVVTEHPDAGEVVWCDDQGVTCRRWNWRQGPRTALTPATTSALFIFDALEPMSDEDLTAAGDALLATLRQNSPELQAATRLLAP